MRALVTGATGFIGKHLLGRLEKPVVLTRNPDHLGRPVGEVYSWDPMSGPPPDAALHDVDVVFHLAGEPVATGRWTAAKRRRIRESRSVGTANLVRGLQSVAGPPRVLVSSSAIGYYGNRGDELLDENAQSGSDFLAEVCREWEAAASVARQYGIHVVNPRTGIVLGRGGGSLDKMLLPFKLGMGAQLGNGRQWMSWIHVDDMVGLLLHAATHDTVTGPMNAVAPHPVTNREFTQSLAQAVQRPAFMRMPGLILKLLAGEFAEVLLASQRVVPQVALDTGYTFRYADLPAALEAIVRG
ncbi:MAG TPA: TIGR01777 family oxidoreductase [Pirellulales bacterium]|nr:TIGR01777 family oxidoreductase [Pirellulales bacterium]